MITKQLETKIVENQDVEAVQLMTRLASFCVIHEHCEFIINMMHGAGMMAVMNAV